MPLVGNNNEPLREVANFAYNGSLWVPVTIDVNGYLNVRLPYTEEIQANGYGWINGTWHKQPINKGISSTYSQTIQNLNLSAGYNTLSSTAVPAGTIRAIQLVSLQYTGTVPTIIRAYPAGGVATPLLIQQSAPVSGQFYTFNGEILFPEGAYITVDVMGATAGDDLVCHILGYNISINL